MILSKLSKKMWFAVGLIATVSHARVYSHNVLREALRPSVPTHAYRTIAIAPERQQEDGHVFSLRRGVRLPEQNSIRIALMLGTLVGVGTIQMLFCHGENQHDRFARSMYDLGLGVLLLVCIELQRRPTFQHVTNGVMDIFIMSMMLVSGVERLLSNIRNRGTMLGVDGIAGRGLNILGLLVAYMRYSRQRA